MTLQRQMVFWTAALIILILSLWLLGDIMLPFIAGLVLAYFLDPVADALERLGLPRIAATLVILTASIVAIVVLLILLLPVLGDQIARFSSNLPSLMQALVKLFNELAPQWLKDMLAASGTNLPASLSDLAGKAAGWLAAILASILSGSLALVNVISLLIVTPIVAFYMLNDWDRMVAQGGWLAAARSPRHDPRPGARDRRGDGGLHPRPGHRLPVARYFLCRGSVLRRAQFRPADRTGGRSLELHSLMSARSSAASSPSAWRSSSSGPTGCRS